MTQPGGAVRTGKVPREERTRERGLSHPHCSVGVNSAGSYAAGSRPHLAHAPCSHGTEMGTAISRWRGRPSGKSDHARGAPARLRSHRDGGDQPGASPRARCGVTQYGAGPAALNFGLPRASAMATSLFRFCRETIVLFQLVVVVFGDLHLRDLCLERDCKLTDNCRNRLHLELPGNIGQHWGGRRLQGVQPLPPWRVSFHLHAIHDGMCMSVRWLFLVLSLFLYLSLLPFSLSQSTCSLSSTPSSMRRGLKKKTQ